MLLSYLIALAVAVTGMTAEMFRGVLLVAQNAANTRVGTFIPAFNTRLTCDVSVL